MKKIIYLLAITLIGCSTENTKQEEQAFICPDVFTPENAVGTLDSPFQGDILIAPKSKQAGVTSGSRLWDDRVIPVYFDERYEGTPQKDSVYKAFKEFESIGFTFIEYSTLPILDSNLPSDMGIVHIKWAGIALSYVGVYGGEQELYLPVKWNTFYDATLHELGHLVGLWHPHNTPRQSEWLNVNRDNIQQDKIDFFEIYNTENFEYGDEYDIYSVMNYSSYVYAIDTSIPTMTLKDGTLFESQSRLTDGDKLSIDRMYNCYELK